MKANDILGTSGDDVIAALGGNDRVVGAGGDDRIAAAPERPACRRLRRRPPRGGAATTTCSVTTAPARLRLRRRHPVRRAGVDFLQAEEGDDILEVARRTTLSRAAGHGHARGRPGDDNVAGGEDDDGSPTPTATTTSTATAGSDVIAGGPGDDDIKGGDEADSLDGEDGDDVVVGGDGTTPDDSADLLDGGEGNDYLDAQGGRRRRRRGRGQRRDLRRRRGRRGPRTARGRLPQRRPRRRQPAGRRGQRRVPLDGGDGTDLSTAGSNVEPRGDVCVHGETYVGCETFSPSELMRMAFEVLAGCPTARLERPGVAPSAPDGGSLPAAPGTRDFLDLPWTEPLEGVAAGPAGRGPRASPATSSGSSRSRGSSTP